MKTVALVLALLLGVAVANPVARQSSSTLENAFNHRPTVESIISCFVGRTRCTPEQDTIKARALATMRNFGRCPDSICTPQERLEMEQAMELLQQKHPDLWGRLIFSVLGIEIGRK